MGGIYVKTPEGYRWNKSTTTTTTTTTTVNVIWKIVRILSIIFKQPQAA